MAVSDDFTINYSLKTVTHTSGATVYTVLVFYQWLATTFAAANQMDDSYPFVADTPTVYRWKNGWDMGDETSYQYLKGASIATSSGAKLFSNLYTLGEQFRNSQIYIIQNSAELTTFWGTGNIDILVKVKDSGTLIDSGNVTVMSRDTDCLYDHTIVDLSSGGRNPVGINTFEDINYKLTGDLYLSVASVTNFDIGNYAYGNSSTASGRIQYIDGATNRLYLCQVEGTFVTSESIKERTSRTTGDTGTTTTNSASTAYTNVVRGFTDITVLFVQRKFTGGTTSNGPFTFGETITQTGSGWTGKFVQEVSNTIYVQNTSGTPNGTGQLSGGSSGALYTPTTTTAQLTVPLDLNNGAGPQPYNCMVNCANRTLVEVYRYLKFATSHNSGTTVNSDAGEEYRSASTGTYADNKQSPFGTYAGGKLFGARGIWYYNMLSTDANNIELTDANNVNQVPTVTTNLVINIVDSEGNSITDSCEVTVVKSSDNSELYHGENVTTGTTTYQYTTAAGTVTYINVINVTGYQPKTVNNYTLPSSNTILNIQLDEDRFYSNP